MTNSKDYEAVSLLRAVHVLFEEHCHKQFDMLSFHSGVSCKVPIETKQRIIEKYPPWVLPVVVTSVLTVLVVLICILLKVLVSPPYSADLIELKITCISF